MKITKQRVQGLNKKKWKPKLELMKIFKSYLIEPQCYNPQSEIELSKPFRLLIPDSATLKNLSMALLGFVSPFPATGILLMEIAHEFS